MSSVLTVDARDIVVGYNSASSSAPTPPAAIDFSAISDAGGFDVPTGATAVKLDFTDKILRASVGDPRPSFAVHLRARELRLREGRRDQRPA